MTKKHILLWLLALFLGFLITKSAKATKVPIFPRTQSPSGGGHYVVYLPLIGGGGGVGGDIPLALSDIYLTTQNTLLLIDSIHGVLANDLYLDPSPVVTLVTPPSIGTLDLQGDGSFSYQPPADFNDLVTFKYQVQGSQATVRIFVGRVITLSNTGVRENLPPQTVVGNLATIDSTSNNHTYSLVAGLGSENNADFAIINNQLVTNVIFDYEAGLSPLRYIRIRSSNGVSSAEKAFIISIQDEVNEPTHPPDLCLYNRWLFYQSQDGMDSTTIENVVISNNSSLGCNWVGNFTIRFQNQVVLTQPMSGHVDRWNTLYLPMSLNDFNFNVAGLNIKAHHIRLSRYPDGRFHISIGRAEVCAPIEWGGDCVDGSSARMKLDKSGFVTQEGKIAIPNFTVRQAFAKQSLPTQLASNIDWPKVLELVAKILLNTTGSIQKTPSGNGYEITVTMGLGLPKVEVVHDCAILVSVTVFKNNLGVTTMTLEPLQTPEGLEFREGTLSLGCEPGIPIGETGLQISGASGTIILQHQMQSVRLAVEISIIDLSNLLKAEVGTTFLWRPEWGLDLDGTATAMNVFQFNAFNAQIRSDRMVFHTYVTSIFIRGDMALYGWWPDGRFHFSGSGTMSVGVPKGSIHHKCIHIPWPINQNICTDVPPIDMEIGGVGMEGGEFTNGNYGFKGYVKLWGYQQGVYIDDQGNQHFGGVGQYVIATPLMINQARAEWQEKEKFFTTDQAIWDNMLSFPAKDEMVLTVQIDPSDVISQVTVLNPSDTIFIVSAQDPLSVTLKSPSGNLITPSNAPNYGTIYTATVIISDTFTYTQYMYIVGTAEIGDWQVNMIGDTTTHPPILAVLGIANVPTLQSATLGDAGDLSQVEVNWSLSSDTPVTVTIHANSDAITHTITVTDSNGITSTEVISNYIGIPVATIPVSHIDQLQNAQTSGLADLTGLESATYALWIEVDNGFLPSINQYVTVTGTHEVAWVEVDNTANLPTTWTAVLTPTIAPTSHQIVVIAEALPYADIDSYTFNIGQTPNNPDTILSNNSVHYHYDASGNPVGPAYLRLTVDGVDPYETYYMSFVAVDEQTGWTVQSQEISVTVPGGDYNLTVPQNSYQVDEGTAVTLTIPIELTILEPLFNPDVFLELDTLALPRGISVFFEGDDSGTIVLNTTTPTAHLIITCDPTVSEGFYHFDLLGFNGDNNKTIPVTLQVGHPAIYLPLVKSTINSKSLSIPYP